MPFVSVETFRKQSDNKKIKIKEKNQQHTTDDQKNKLHPNKNTKDKKDKKRGEEEQ